MEPTLTKRQLYYKDYYIRNKDHILAVVQKYQDTHVEEKRAYWKKYNRIYYLRCKQMKPQVEKAPRLVKEKLKKIPLEVTTLLAETKTEVKKPARNPKPKVPETIKPPVIKKEKPKYEHLKGEYTLSFD